MKEHLIILFLITIRKPEKSESEEEFSQCPHCHQRVPDYELLCPSCQLALPYCIVTVRRIFLFCFTDDI